MFRNVYLNAVYAALISFLLCACATTSDLTSEQIQERYQAVTMLGSELGHEAEDLATLSPKNHEAAVVAYRKAREMALKDNAKAEGVAKKGLQALTDARSSAATSKDVLSEVLAVRSKAQAAGSPVLFSERYKKANDQLIYLTQLVENDEIEKVKSQRLKLANEFADIELAALKRNAVDIADMAIKEAMKQGVDKNAPKSLARAKAEMKLATDLLEMDRVDNVKAEQHAENALWWTERAVSISDTVRDYENANYTSEDMLLWYQEQLENALEPLNTALEFNKPNRKMIQDINSEIALVVSQKNQLAMENKELMTQNQGLATASQQAEKVHQSKISMTKEEANRDDKKFAFIQALFNEREAEVYRKKNEVLIRALGFKFATGKTEISADNFALMQKIIRSINEYPGARVVVSGHTDATGSPEMNQKLSEERAAKVAKFLVDVGQLESSRIQAKGYGESRPLASNSTEDGRVANRRIEISLVN